MNADWVEKFLFKEFSEFFGSIYSINEDDGLIKSEDVKEVAESFNFFALCYSMATSVMNT